MGCSLCYKEVPVDPRDKKQSKVNIEIITESRNLISFTSPPKIKNKNKFKHDKNSKSNRNKFDVEISDGSSTG